LNPHLQTIRYLKDEEWRSVITKILFSSFKKDGLQKVYKNKTYVIDDQRCKFVDN